MDKYRLLLSALFVALSWGCMRTFAQTTVDPNSTITAITTTEITANVTAKTIPSTTAETTTNITAETTTNITAETTTNITAETTTNITPETTRNITAETTTNITAETTTNITAETTTNITAETTTNITAETTANITAETTRNITAETTTNITAETTTNITAETTANITAETTTNITAETTTNITAETTTNITAETTTNITPETTTNITAETTTNITAETTTNITAETTTNITAETTANITAETTTNITPETTTNITAETTTNITAETTTNITVETTTNITAETTANITAETTAHITAETTTNITAETTANITAETTANITAKTTANITAETTSNITVETTTNITVETTAIITTVVFNTTVAPTVPPVPPNNTVLSLLETVHKTGCGTTQLCAAEPSECDPSDADASCFFLGAKLTDGNNFEFALSGQSNGYIAASVLSPLNGKIVTYVCANSNNQVKCFGAIHENGILNLTTLHVTSVKGKVTGATIQCTFLATVPDPLDLTTKIRARRATNVTLSLSTGSFDATSQRLGTPSAVIRATVDLAQPKTTVVNTIPKEAPTVAVLQTPVSNTGCGSEKLCRADPSSCNPAAVGTCSFFSAKQNTAQIYFLEISGQSSGYIGSILSNDTTWGNNDLAYLCANNNGRVTFITALFNGTQLTVSQLNGTSGSEAGRVDGNTIQCSFEATLPDINTRAADYAVAMINGTYDTGTGVLGNPFILFNTSVLNLTDVANSSPGVVPHQRSLLHVLLFSATVLSLTILTGH